MTRIIRAADRDTKTQPAANFVGTVYADEVVVGEAPSRMRATRVTFTPGARTNWHSHPVGQVLFCLTGVGRYQLEGDRVWTDCSELWAEYPVIPPVTHWPGYFKEVMIKACMLEFALSIREDRQLRNQLYTELYGDPRKPGELGYFSIATDMDSQAQPSFPADGGRNPVHSAGWAEGDIRNDFDEF